MSNFNRIGYKVPSELTETSSRGSVFSMIALVAIGSVLVMETRSYFSSSVGANVALHRSIGDQSVQLNFNITMLDLPCNYAAVDVFSTTGHQKDIVKNIKKFPIDINGVLLNDEEQTWHQNDVELWDPAVWETIENLHEDGEDAIRLNNESFPFALSNFPMVVVNFYSGDCSSCDDLAPTYEALGEIVTDTAMSLVDSLHHIEFSEEEYERKVNEMAPVLITKLDCSDYPNICNEQKVRAYPSMRIYFDGVAEGEYQGHRTVMELVSWITQMEAKFRKPHELKMQKVIEFANERVIRTKEEEDWNHEISIRRAPLNITQHAGCQISGTLDVDRAPGKFVIHSNSYGHSIAPHMTNLSHIINHFSFGSIQDQKFASDSLIKSSPRLQTSLHPLDEHTFITSELHQAHHHHLQVVTTEIEKNMVHKFQLTKEMIARVYRIKATSHLSSYRHFIVPEAQFSYDMSPIAISYATISKTWYEYITCLLAIIGGTFTVIGLMDSGISSVIPGKKSVLYY